jgi:hypothetical protein
MPPEVSRAGAGAGAGVIKHTDDVNSVDVEKKSAEQNKTPSEQATTPQPPPPKPSDAEIAARKGEKGLEGEARKIELHNQLHKKYAMATEFSAKTKAIAEDPKLKEGPKQEELRKLMQSAGKEEFGRAIADAKGWSNDAKYDFSRAVGTSDTLMKRVGSELPPDAQLEAVHNVNQWSAGGPEIHRNVSKWIKGADPALLNKAIEKGTSVDEPGGMIADKLRFENDKDTLSKLSDKSKTAVVRNSISISDPRFAHTAKEVYRGLPAEHKNGLVDSLQEDGRLKDFVQLMDAKDIAQGMTPQNAGVIAAEYNKLATTEKNARWSSAASQIDGYAENRFKGSDYDAYLKIRDQYHSR